jgi:hypothetical protein
MLGRIRQAILAGGAGLAGLDRVHRSEDYLSEAFFFLVTLQNETSIVAVNPSKKPTILAPWRDG